MAEGAFVPFTGIADLRSSPNPPEINPGLWAAQPVVPGEGWWFAGRGWQPMGSRSFLDLWRRPGAGTVLVLDIEQRAVAQVPSYRIEVVLNESRLEALQTAPGRQQLRLSVPPNLLTEVNRLEFLIEPSPGFSAGELPLSFLRFGLEGASGSAARTQRLPVGSESGSTPLLITAAGTFVISVEVPDEASELEIGLSSSSTAPGSIRSFALSELSERIELGAFRIPSEGGHVVSVPTAAIQGQRVSLGLEVELPGPVNRLELEELRFVLAPLSEPAPAPGRVSSTANSGDLNSSAAQPDVLLIILDAARGDRFPGWDYPRQVMPVIEELSRSSISFRHAFAECPTTSCSIPALISGQSFLPGGQVGDGQQLAEEVETLAEHLQDLGYSTVGLSATPNNSASRNHDQGFDRFLELWGKNNPDHGPFNLSRLASEVIAEQPGEVPLFLQLHYLPPHQPYAPGEEFDRFTDSAYGGPIRPDMSLKLYNLGMQDLTGPDLEHLIGLYDGNLLRADAAVGQVLRALEAAGRFEDSLIVVTSDHGEAFMEHRRQGHNTTLFDEMLHIPLLIRLPGGEVPAVNTGRLASELDVVPTILGRLGIPAQGNLDGLDLLGTVPNPLRPRTLFFRSSHPDQPLLAARTSVWKAIAWPQHRLQMLFDLERDPAEAINRVGEHPHRYAGLGLRLRQHLRTRPMFSAEPEEVRLTAEEAEALKTLGYLD